MQLVWNDDSADVKTATRTCKTSTHAEYAPLQHLLQNAIVVRVNVYAALVTIRIFNEKVYLSHVLFFPRWFHFRNRHKYRPKGYWFKDGF